MRGKFAYYWDIFGPYGYASMRPAHYAREVRGILVEAVGSRHASMRPAHYAREVSAFATDAKP